jgi:SAM-dependent methyltransferase
MDGLFGEDNFQNEIAWYYYNKLHGARKKCIPKAFDQILYYVKNREASYTYHTITEPRDKPVTKLKYRFTGGKIVNLKDEEGKTITYESTKRQLDNVWRLRCLQPANKQEWVNFDTQKPIDLIERILSIASNEGDLVLDAFCGSGTTLIAAEQNRRRWIGCDIGRFPIHITRKRLLDLQRKLHAEGKPYRAFDVFNLGRYERQWWQKEHLHGADEEHRRVVLEFFRAEPLSNTPSPLIHGKKAGAFCHVDGIDSIFTRGEAHELAKAVAAAGGRECYVLAWEFEMDLRLTTAALEKELGVKVKLIQIPREIMEKNRKNPPPFLEMAVLEADPVFHGKGKDRTVDIKLTKFLPSLAEVPAKELEALKERAVQSGFDFIDFWAVDFDWTPGKPFNHHWQDYRTRKDRSLKTVSEAAYRYEKNGSHTACVKVVDVFGCDTSITVEVKP